MPGFARHGLAGVDIPAYRATEAEPLDLVAACRRGLIDQGAVVVAGSANSAERVSAVRADGRGRVHHWDGGDRTALTRPAPGPLAAHLQAALAHCGACSRSLSAVTRSAAASTAPGVLLAFSSLEDNNMAKRKLAFYYAWSRPGETEAPLPVIEKRGALELHRRRRRQPSPGVAECCRPSGRDALAALDERGDAVNDRVYRWRGPGATSYVSFRRACASASLTNLSGSQFSSSAWRIRSCWVFGAMPPFGGSRSRLVGKE